MNPLLAPMPMSPVEVADLVRRVRINMDRTGYYDERIERAVELVDRGKTPRQAMRITGATHSGLYSALHRRRLRAVRRRRSR